MSSAFSLYIVHPQACIVSSIFDFGNFDRMAIFGMVPHDLALLIAIVSGVHLFTGDDVYDLSLRFVIMQKPVSVAVYSLVSLT